MAVGIAISPVPIIAVILMLFSARASRLGPAFMVGWIGGLLIGGAILLAVADPAGVSDDDGASTTSSIIHLALGLALVFLAYRQWQKRPKPGEHPELPKALQAVDKLSIPVALGMGALLSTINPKNLILLAGGATAIASVGLSTADAAIALLVFVLIASVSIIVPVVWYLVDRDRASHSLARLRDWLAQHNAVVMMVLLLVIGVSQIGTAISGLSD
jgi:hypothetical protein